MARARAGWILGALFLAGGCSGVGCGGGDGGQTRSFRLALTGTQLRIDAPVGLQLTAADLAADADVISLHQDFYGLPWEAFEAGTAPPAEWLAALDRLSAVVAAADKPVFLSLQLVSGTGRRFLASRAVVVDGELQQEEGWSAECYDFSSAPDAAGRRAAYLAYVDWMVRRFQPDWVNVAIEMNLFSTCPAQAWDALVEVERAAYAAAKAARPSVVAFPSIQIDALHGYSEGFCPSGQTREACFEANLAQLQGLEMDRFALSTYPHLIPELSRVEDLPADWFTRAASRLGLAPVVGEVGWLASDAVGLHPTGCLTALEGDPGAQAAYFTRLLDDAQAAGMELVTWWSDRDLVPAELMTDCPCDFDPTWCTVLDIFRSVGGDDPLAQFYGEMTAKVWGSMGLRDYQGVPREPIHGLWQERRALPVAEPD
ncbi:MAG TPA: hypothetical protein PK668_02370 [Myxococcota bacterium]|nr:hypothetical protein [Myxococcota bacterium]HRY94586.1 hypothetical protein [Myxococcota bacterium]HSA20332.1 hypothetical protein [Myxococcota bacterium]